MHLLYKKIDTAYMIEAFICRCGHKDFIIKEERQRLDYVCENQKFYDAN